MEWIVHTKVLLQFKQAGRRWGNATLGLNCWRTC